MGVYVKLDMATEYDSKRVRVCVPGFSTLAKTYDELNDAAKEDIYDTLKVLMNEGEIIPVKVSDNKPPFEIAGSHIHNFLLLPDVLGNYVLRHNKLIRGE